MIRCEQNHTQFGRCRLEPGHAGEHVSEAGYVWMNLCQFKDQPETDTVGDIIAERGRVYGEPRSSHANIGLSWTGLIQQHYGLTLDHPLPDYLVAMMMVAFKNQRSCRVYKEDNFLDLQAYGRFAEEFQKLEDVK